MGASVPAVSAAAPAATYVPPAQAAYNPYGGFWIRVVATLLDGVIISAIATPLAFVFLLPSIIKIVRAGEASQDPPPEALGAIFLVIPLIFAAMWLYESLMTSSSWQGTVGKRVLHLKVTDVVGNKISFGRATGRFFAKLISQTLLSSLVYIVVAFTERKQGLHDMIAGTLVMKY
ncbi:MAG TPA: RDD family protein [Candidatus Angelobacter sp.]|nr:RDD family protein [Candidatus Angelobacter sp.]